jgi:hypothetical protein
MFKNNCVQFCVGNWHTNYESTSASKKYKYFSFTLVVYVRRLFLESRLEALPRLPESSVFVYIKKRSPDHLKSAPLSLYMSAVF